MDTLISQVAFERNVFVLSVYETTIWPYKTKCMHPPCNTLLNLHEPIHCHPLHLHVHIEFKEKPLDVKDLVQLMKVLHLGQPPHM
jgi:hypothetical protein